MFEQLRQDAAPLTPAYVEIDRRGRYRPTVTPKGRPPANKGKRYPVEVLTSDEVYRLISACGRGACGKRNRAMIMVGWRAGLRCNEVLNLLPKDVDTKLGRIQVLNGKGGKDRLVAIDPAACAMIDQWIEARAKLGVTGRQPLFCVVSKPTTGERMHNVQVRIMMAALGRKAGIEKRCHFHGLRHTYASYALENNVPIHYLRRQLGHSSIAVTEIYADHVNPARVLDHLRAMEWPEAPGRAA